MSSGPFSPPSSGSGLGVPVQSGTSSTGSPTPPGEFAALARVRITGMIGAQAYLIPTNELNALITKLWQQPGIQSDWGLYESDKTRWGASLYQSIQNQILGGSADDSLTVDYTNLKLAAGKGLSLAEQAALANVTQAQGAQVPSPFTTRNVSGYDYGAPMPAGGWTGTGESFGWDKHYGIDYGTPAGSRIVAPFAGTIEVKTGVAGYGNQVLLHLDNGWVMGFGHVAQGYGNGSRVNPGDLIAMSGKNVGSAQGAVTIVTWQNPKGKYENPHDILDPIFGGVTFSQFRMPDGSPIPGGWAGTGMPSVNKILDTEYPSIRSDWVTYFGSPPSPQDVYNVLQNGTSPQEWSDYIRAMPSHIPGLAAGQAFDLRSQADALSQKMYGHLSTDGIVADLYNQKLTTPNDIKYYYDMMPGKDLDRQTYNRVLDANTKITYNISNEKGADPRVIAHQIQTANLNNPEGGRASGVQTGE